MTVAKGPLPKAGSAPTVSKSQGSVIAATVAVEHAPNRATPTASAKSASSQRHHTSGYAITPRNKPIARPVRSSRRTIRRIGTPTERPRTTTVSVCDAGPYRRRIAIHERTYYGFRGRRQEDLDGQDARELICFTHYEMAGTFVVTSPQGVQRFLGALSGCEDRNVRARMLGGSFKGHVALGTNVVAQG